MTLQTPNISQVVTMSTTLPLPLSLSPHPAMHAKNTLLVQFTELCYVHFLANCVGKISLVHLVNLIFVASSLKACKNIFCVMWKHMKIEITQNIKNVRGRSAFQHKS